MSDENSTSARGELPAAGAGATRANARRWLVVFGAGAIAIGALVFAIGWFGPIRAIASYAVLSVLVAAFLPFVILLGLVAIGVAIAGLSIAVAALGAALGSGDGAAAGLVAGGETTELGFWSFEGLSGPYYRFFAKRDHPLLWSIPAGVLVGAAALALMIWLVLVPAEARTLEILARLEQGIREHEKAHGVFPRPTSGGGIESAALGGGYETDSQGQVVDGFGRPVAFEIGIIDQSAGIAFQSGDGPGVVISRSGEFERFTLRSLGFDRRPSDDDLTISGIAAKARSEGDSTIDAVRGLFGGQEKDSGVRSRLKSLLDFRNRSEGS